MDATNEYNEDGNQKGKIKRKRKKTRSFLAKLVRSTLFINYLQNKNHKEKVVVVSNLEPLQNISSSSTSSTSSSGFSSLSIASSTMESYPTDGGRKKKKSIVRIKSRMSDDRFRYKNYGYFAIDFGFLLLVSLIVILVWGRICAILWTSSCLFLSYKRRPELMLLATSIDDANCDNDGDDDDDMLLTLKSSQELKMPSAANGENESKFEDLIEVN